MNAPSRTIAEGRVASYEKNPRHRRADLLRITPRGHETLSQTRAAQRTWANSVAAHLDADQPEQTSAFIDRALDLLARHAPAVD